MHGGPALTEGALSLAAPLSSPPPSPRLRDHPSCLLLGPGRLQSPLVSPGCAPPFAVSLHPASAQTDSVVNSLQYKAAIVSGRGPGRLTEEKH